MVETAHMRDPRLGIPVWSLYGETRVAHARDARRGSTCCWWTCRTWAPASTPTSGRCGSRWGPAGAPGVRVVVLDRPNPIGGVAVEGNVLDPEVKSFVGLEPIPMRHGMTVGEMATLVRASAGASSCELDVVPPLAAGGAEMHWPDTGRPWVMTSPNLPACETALVYPGTVLLEGTKASEGRGTTRPFEIVGGAWGRAEELAAEMARRDCRASSFAPSRFSPPSTNGRAGPATASSCT